MSSSLPGISAAARDAAHRRALADASRIIGADIYPDVKQSDHCPVFLELMK